MAPKPSLLRHSDFMRLWVGQTISLFGSQFTLLAVPIIAAQLLGANALQMGLLAAAESAPFLLLGLPVGVWVDRYPRRPILIVGDVGRAVVLLLIPAAALLGFINMPLMYAVSFIVGVLTVFFEIAYQAYLPSLVERGHLVEGNTKLEATRALAQVSGPGVAGVILQLVFQPLAIVIDAVSFLISGGFLVAIHKGEPQPDRSSRSTLLAEMRQGLAVVLGDRRLRAIAGCTSTSNFFGSAAGALIILFALRELGLDSLSLGIVFSAASVGAVVGAGFAGRVAARLGLGRTIWTSALLGGLGSLPLLVATPANALPVLTVGFFLTLFTVPVYNINQVSLRQAITPDHLQGRMNATMRFLVWGTMPLGALAGGALGATLGLRLGITVAVVGGLFAFVWVLLSPVSALDEIPQAEEVPEAPGLPMAASSVVLASEELEG